MADRILGALLGSISVGALLSIGISDMQVRGPDPGPKALPYFTFLVLFVLSLALIFDPQASEGYPRGLAAYRVYTTLSLLLLYPFILEPIGFVIASSLLLIAIALILGLRTWWEISIAPILIALSTFILFRDFLNVSIPPGILGGVL